MKSSFRKKQGFSRAVVSNSREKLSFFTIKNRLIIAFALILLLPSIAIAVGSYETAKQKIDQKLIQSAQQNVQLLNGIYTQFLKAKKLDVALLAQSIDAQKMQLTGENQQIEAEISKYRKTHEEVEAAFVGSVDTGKMIMYPQQSSVLKEDNRQKNWFVEAVANKGSIIVTPPYHSEATNNLVITLAKVTNDGHGVVGINIDLKELSAISKTVKIGNEGYVYVLDKDYNILVHPTLEPGSKALKMEANDNMYKSESGYFEYLYNDTDWKKMVFTTNQETGWKLAGTMYSNEVDQEASPILYNTLIVLAIAIILGALLVTYMIRGITRPLQVMSEASRKISEGDLTEQINVKRNDELGELSKLFNEMAASLRTVLLRVSESTMQLSSSAEQLSASAEQSSKSSEQVSQSIQEVANGTDIQLTHVEDTTKAVNEMSNQVQQIARNADTVTSSAAEAADKADEGNESIQRAVTQMNSISGRVELLGDAVQALGARSSEIGSIVDVITSISAQTNLLALNAAIEAARAGEHGRGFAVVADEVRKLAEQSSESAGQISQLIAAIQADTSSTIETMHAVTQEVNDGINVVNTAGVSFEHIMKAIGAAASQIKQVSRAAGQIAERTQQVASAMNTVSSISEQSVSGVQNVSAATEEQLASMEEITASAASLTNMAEELQTLISKFRL